MHIYYDYYYYVFMIWGFVDNHEEREKIILHGNFKFSLWFVLFYLFWNVAILWWHVWSRDHIKLILSSRDLITRIFVV